MNVATFRSLLLLLLVGAFAGPADVRAQEQPPAPPEPPAAAQAPDAEAADADESADPDVDDDRRQVRRRFRRIPRSGNEIVSFWSDSVLPAGESADVVVTIFGSSTINGPVEETVVTINGDTRVNGPVGDEVVTVMGDVYINSTVGGDVVSVLGSVELGPQARVEGDVIATFGDGVSRHPSAVVSGGVKDVLRGFRSRVRPWVEHGLFYARPLALQPGLGWAWVLALGFLAFYVLLGLIFREQIEKCVQTFEDHPGHSLLTALLAVMLTPVLTFVLVLTLVGIAVVPFLQLAIVAGIVFGKAVIMAWLGRRCIRSYGPTALAVAIGGLIVLALYVVPVVGFISFVLLGMIGFGIVLYTLILGFKASRQKPAAAAVGAAPHASVPPVEPTSDTSGLAATPDAAPGIPAVTASMLPRAGFWIRMGALLIDAVLMGIVASVVFDEIDAFLPLLAGYGALMWKLRGTTVGGIICNLQVVRLDGRELDWATAVVRALGCFLSLIAVGLGFLWIVFDDERQAWHDKIAGTVVVRVPKGTSLL